MIKWEYFIFASDSQVTKAQLDSFGNQGWELVTINAHGTIFAIFKRPVQENQQLNG